MALLLLGGLTGAVYRALIWPQLERERTFIVVAPERAEVSIPSGPPVLTSTSGVHSFAVMPGPLTLEVRHPELPPQTAQLTIPKGLGGLMVEVQYNENGQLELGYF
jgi:hypothetical protein